MELSAVLASRDRAHLGTALRRAGALAGDVEVEEALLQAYLFLGFPAVLEAMSLWREVRGGASAGEGEVAVHGEAAGAAVDGEAASRSNDRDIAAWFRRGEALCRRIYGPAYEKLRHNVRRLHPALDRWMVLEGYGKVLSRPGLDVTVRELCIVALLVVDGRQPQLHSHLRGALRLGATEEAVDAAVRIGLSRTPDPARREAVTELWSRVKAAAVNRKGASRDP